MSGVKRYNALGDIDGGYLKSAADGRVVLHTDHLASHAYDEAVERELCEKYIQAQQARLEKGGFSPMTRTEESAMRGAWKECAKSRAKRFGCTEQTMEPDKLDRPDIGDYAKRTAEDLRRRLDK